MKTIELTEQECDLIKTMMEDITMGEIAYSRFSNQVAQNIINKIEKE